MFMALVKKLIENEMVTLGLIPNEYNVIHLRALYGVLNSNLYV